MYEQVDLARAQAQARRESAMVFSLLAAGLLLAALGLIVRNRWLGAIGLALFWMLAYARYGLYAAPRWRYRKFLREMSGGLARASEGWFVGVEDEVRLSEDGVAVRALSVSEAPDGSQPLLYYWDAQYELPALTPGQALSLTTYGRYIRALHPKSRENALIN